MSASVDNRLLERWLASRQRQEEARRFVAGGRFPDPRAEARSLDEILATIDDLEQMLLNRTARRWPSSYDPGPLSA